MRKVRTPKLIPLDMKLSDGCNHPQVNCRKTYLVLVGSEFAVGKFSREWYGLNFDGLYPAGCQFDAPGTNASEWKQIWEFRY